LALCVATSPQISRLGDSPLARSEPISRIHRKIAGADRDQGVGVSRCRFSQRAELRALRRAVFLLFFVGARRAVPAARFVDVARLAAAERLMGARFAFRWLALLAFFFAVVAIALSLLTSSSSQPQSTPLCRRRPKMQDDS
jgi:hypothetical protein